jgi:hypothetical protein
MKSYTSTGAGSKRATVRSSQKWMYEATNKTKADGISNVFNHQSTCILFYSADSHCLPMIEPPPSATSLAVLRLQFFGFILKLKVRGDLHDHWRPSSKTQAHLSTTAGQSFAIRPLSTACPVADWPVDGSTGRGFFPARISQLKVIGDHFLLINQFPYTMCGHISSSKPF